MTWWRRPGLGRRPRRDALPAAVEPARIGPVPSDPQPRGLVRLVFADGSAVAIDAHDPRGRAFRALADAMLAPGPSGPAQDRPPAADAQQETGAGEAPGERGRG